MNLETGNIPARGQTPEAFSYFFGTEPGRSLPALVRRSDASHEGLPPSAPAVKLEHFCWSDYVLYASTRGGSIDGQVQSFALQLKPDDVTALGRVADRGDRSPQAEARPWAPFARGVRVRGLPALARF